MSNYNKPDSAQIPQEIIESGRVQREMEMQEGNLFDYDRDDYTNWTLPWYDDEVDPGFECPACFGSGLDRHEDVDCMNCWGEGRVYGNL